MDEQTIADIRATVNRLKAVRQLAKDEGNAAYDYGEFEKAAGHMENNAEGWLAALLNYYDTNEAQRKWITLMLAHVAKRERDSRKR